MPPHTEREKTKRDRHTSVLWSETYTHDEGLLLL